MSTTLTSLKVKQLIIHLSEIVSLSNSGKQYVWVCHLLTHWPQGELIEILELNYFEVWFIDWWFIYHVFVVTNYHWTKLMRSQKLVQVMAWFRQAPSNHLSQCWSRFMSPYGIARPESVNRLGHPDSSTFLCWQPMNIFSWNTCYVCWLKHISPWTKWPPFWQTTFWNAFSWMKSFVFWIEFHWSVFLRVQLTITQHWFR